jgi:hypothetical protein
VQRAAAAGVERFPVRAENQISQSVAVNVQVGDADVVGLGLAAQDGAWFPGRILVPQYAVRIDYDDVRFAVVVDVAQVDRVADGQSFLELD